MLSYISGLPAQGGSLISADVRNNFEALNARTNRLTAQATIPASTSVTVGTGVVYFQNRTFVDFPGALLNLGDESTGVLPFNNIGFFKDIVLVVRVSLDPATNRFIATAVFLEGPEKASSVPEPDLVLLRGTDLPITSFVVRHNGLNVGGSAHGEIQPINQTDLLDYRSYIDVGGLTYFSSTVGDREVTRDGYGATILDGYTGLPVITGSSAGEFTGSITDAYGIQSPIQQAIDAVSATGGGTVFIRKGIYTPAQTIDIPDNVNLVGEGSATVIVRIDTYVGPLFRVTGDNITIADLSIQGPSTTVFATDPLIKLVSSAFCTIRNCSITNATVTAISLEAVSTRNMCINNYIHNASVAVNISSDSSKNLVTGSQFIGSTTTDIVNAGTNNLVTSNVGS